MSENKENKDGQEVTDLQQQEENAKKVKTYFFISLGCFIAGCILFVLAMVFTFAVKNGTAIYFLISSMIFELASVSFLNAMKQRGYVGNLRTVFVILSYVVMCAALIIFLMGTVANGVGKA